MTTMTTPPAVAGLSGGLGQVILATIASTAGFWAWMSIAPLQNIYATQMGLDQGRISLMLATPVLVGALGRIVTGVLTDRFGGRVMFTVVLLASVPAVLLVALALRKEHLQEDREVADFILVDRANQHAIGAQ